MVKINQRDTRSAIFSAHYRGVRAGSEGGNDGRFQIIGRSKTAGCDFGLLPIPPIVVRVDYNVAAVNYGNGWIRQRATHSKGAQGWPERAHNDLFWLVPANNEASDQHILSGANHSPGRNVGRFSEWRDLAAQQSIRFVGELKMTTSGRMNIIPEKILIRIDPRCALGRINCVDEVVMCGLAQDTDHIEPDIEGVNINGNPAPLESANGRSNDGIEMIAINRRSVVKCQDPGWIAERILAPRLGVEHWERGNFGRQRWPAAQSDLRRD